MSATGHLHSKDASIKVICGAGTINLSAHGNTTNFEFSGDQLEATAYGDVNHTFLDGLTVFSMGYNGWWAGSAPAGGEDTDSAAACMMSLVGNGATCAPELFFSPAGSTSGSPTYHACVNVQATPFAFPADNIATMNANFTARAGSLSTCPNSVWA